MDAETGELLATADALYVAAPPDRKQALKDRYRFRLVRDDAAPSGSTRATAMTLEAEPGRARAIGEPDEPPRGPAKALP